MCNRAASLKTWYAIDAVIGCIFGVGTLFYFGLYGISALTASYLSLFTKSCACALCTCIKFVPWSNCCYIDVSALLVRWNLPKIWLSAAIGTSAGSWTRGCVYIWMRQCGLWCSRCSHFKFRQQVILGYKCEHCVNSSDVFTLCFEPVTAFFYSYCCTREEISSWHFLVFVLVFLSACLPGCLECMAVVWWLVVAFVQTGLVRQSSKEGSLGHLCHVLFSCYIFQDVSGLVVWKFLW